VCIGLEDDPNGNNSIISRSGADIKHKEELGQVQVKQDISYHYIHDMSYIFESHTLGKYERNPLQQKRVP